MKVHPIIYLIPSGMGKVVATEIVAVLRLECRGSIRNYLCQWRRTLKSVFAKMRFMEMKMLLLRSLNCLLFSLPAQDESLSPQVFCTNCFTLLFCAPYTQHTPLYSVVIAITCVAYYYTVIKYKTTVNSGY